MLFINLISLNAANQKENIALNKNVVVSSELPGYPKENAVDDSPTTGWASSLTEPTAEIYVDLGEDAHFDEIVITWHDVHYALNYTIQTSDDTFTWDDLKANIGGVPGTKTINDGYAYNKRYVRIVCNTKAKSDGTYAVLDFRVNQTSPDYVGSQGISAGEAHLVQLDLDGTTPYIAYQDWENDRKIAVKTFNGSSWVDVGSITSDVVLDIALAVDDETHAIYVAYRDIHNAIKVQKYSGGTWSPLGNIPYTTEGKVDLIIDKSGTTNIPYIAFNDIGIDPETGIDCTNKITVMKFESGTWQVVGTRGSTFRNPAIEYDQLEITYFSLALDNINELYVAYSLGLVESPAITNDYLYPIHKERATVMKYNTKKNLWETVGFPMFTFTRSNFISIDFDGNNTPYIAIQDMYLRNGTSLWKLSSSASPHGKAFSYVSNTGPYVCTTYVGLSFYNNIPYISYSSIGDYGRANVAKYTDGKWRTIGGFPGCFSKAASVYNSHKIDTNGTIYVAYSDWDANGKVSVVKYEQELF